MFFCQISLFLAGKILNRKKKILLAFLLIVSFQTSL